MDPSANPPIILLAEDDEDDYFLLKDAFKESGSVSRLQRVKDGEDLMDYLLGQGAYKDSQPAPSPSLILLDLNMPKKDGREALKEIRSVEALKKIPVVVLTTSRSPEDIVHAYSLGANAFVRKPVRFEQLVHTIKILEKFWLEISELPPRPSI